jgi:hypothetical protein
MEANTVILSLSEYNILRDFMTNLEKENTYRVSDYKVVLGGSYSQAPTFVSTDKAVKEIADICNKLEKKLDELYTENSELKQGILKDRDYEIDRAKKMSVWEFIKWRKR